MSKFRVLYQAVPYVHTSPGVLLIETDSAAEAWAVAYHELTRRGMAVHVPYSGGGCNGIRQDELEALGIFPPPLHAGHYGPNGNVHIRSIEEHKVVVRGKVVEG